MGHLSPSDQITGNSPQPLQNEDHCIEDDQANSLVLVSDQPAAPDSNSTWSQSMLPDALSLNDPTHQVQADQHVWAEDVHPQSSINTTLNVPEASTHAAIASSSQYFWPPQQTSAIAAPQNFTGFYNPHLMPSQMMVQPQALPNVNPINQSFYPQQIIPTPFLPAPIPTTRTPCPHCTESFARASDLNRHWQSVHLGIKYHCDYWLGCPNNGGKGYCRLEKLRTHQREKHRFAWS